MKYFFSLIAFTALLSFRYLDDIYSLSIKTMGGKKVELSQFKGKKMLFIILPSSGQDTSVSADEINQLQTKYQNSLVIIGIPSEDMGFKKSDEAGLKHLYKDSSSSFILAEGMKVKKEVGQSDVFQWLTSKDKNRHFDQDVRGVGSKFFVDEEGELYAVLGPQLRLSSPLMDRILSRQANKKQ